MVTKQGDQMKELAWIEEARKYIGIKEVKGGSTHPKISQMLDGMGTYNGEARAWWHNDETPWCGLFVGHCLGVSGRYVVREWYRAKAWKSHQMTQLLQPAYGCVVVFDRDGGGHVGFVVGRDRNQNLMVLGGNQLDGVTISPFKLSRAEGYYWPSTVIDKKPSLSSPLIERFDLPVLASNGNLSINEA